jgi:hypothetical protein
MDGGGDDPELQRRLLEERPVARDEARRQPVAGLEDPVNGVGIDGFVVAEVRPAFESCE